MTNTIIEAAENYINNHLRDEFTLTDIAEYCGYSPFHFSRMFKSHTGKTVMEYVRCKRIRAAAHNLQSNPNICKIAIEYGFDTHAGFIKAFKTVCGCLPREYAAHYHADYWKGFENMTNANIIIRSIRPEDVNDLWENVYSAMTPKEIVEEKIKPAIENENAKLGVELVAEVDGRVVMALPLVKPLWLPMGVLFDNNFVLTGTDTDQLMKMLLNEMTIRCKEMGITTILLPESGEENATAFKHFGFDEVWKANDFTYLMMNV